MDVLKPMIDFDFFIKSNAFMCNTMVCPRRDLNPQPISYEPTALTIELQGR